LYLQFSEAKPAQAGRDFTGKLYPDRQWEINWRQENRRAHQQHVLGGVFCLAILDYTGSRAACSTNSATVIEYCF
jgi:hypothetical protein